LRERASLTIIRPTMAPRHSLRNHPSLRVVIGLFTPLLLLVRAPVAISQNELVRVEIVADALSIRPGTPFWAGVRFQMKENWHVNWVNPGDAGLAPSVAWRLPEGFAVGELLWPYPHAYEIGHLMIFGYSGEVVALARITPPADLDTGASVTIAADVDWLACEEGCVPGSARALLAIPVRSEPPVPDEKWRSVIQETRRLLPAESENWSVRASVFDEDRYLLEVRYRKAVANPVVRCRFYPRDPEVVENAAPQDLDRRANGFDLVLKRANMSLEAPSRLAGVLVAEPGWDEEGRMPALSIDVPMEQR
jgi:DsbC/DsbD-like thiol-disulfide interchange protein